MLRGGGLGNPGQGGLGKPQAVYDGQLTDGHSEVTLSILKKRKRLLFVYILQTSKQDLYTIIFIHFYSLYINWSNIHEFESFCSGHLELTSMAHLVRREAEDYCVRLSPRVLVRP